jgi:hypothetical protein
MMKVQGKLKLKIDTQVVSEKFSKREFVLTTNDQYPQDILFQLTQEKCNLLDGININQEIEVSFNLRGREWTSLQGEIKYFNTLEAWKIDTVNGTVVNTPQNSNNDPF